jgi:predicted  nucleic acid-binding Zn-ribbon protein
MSAAQIITDALIEIGREIDDRHSAIMAGITNIGNLLMALAPEVQALHDAVAAQGVAITDATTELTKLEGLATANATQIATLQAQLAAGGPAIDAVDLAEIVANTNTILQSITNIKAAMPQPVPAPVVDAAAAASA